MISLAQVTEGVQATPLLATIYGPPGIGKTTLAAQAPAPLFLPTEHGTNQLNVKRLPLPKSLGDVIGICRELGKGGHPYQTLVIDTITGVQDLIYKAVCEEGGKKNIEDFGYGKGYVFALGQWAKLIAALEETRAAGLHILLLAHEATKRVPNPAGADYEQRVPDLYKEANNLLYRWVDNVFHATWKMAVVVADKANDKSKGKGVTNGARVAHCEWRPDAVAKNRFHLPYEMPLDFGAIYDAIEATGAVGEAVPAFAKEARDLIEHAGTEAQQATVLAKIDALQLAGDLGGLRRAVNYLRGKANLETVVT